jgi:hypothetical protein
VSWLAAGLILGQAAVFAPSGYGATVTVADRSEARVRRVPNEPNAVDLETSPSVVLSFNGRRSTLLLGYGARGAVINATNQAESILSQSGRVGMGWATTRRLHLDVTGEGTYGVQQAAGLTAPQALGPPAATPPSSTFTAPGNTVKSISYRGTAGASYQLSRAWDTSLLGVYAGGEGLGDSVTVIEPYQGPSGQFSLGYRAGRADRLTTRARVGYVYGSNLGSQYLDAMVMESWSHTWSERTSGSVGAGVAWFRGRAKRDDPLLSHPAPVGEALIAHVMPLRTGETLSVNGATRLGVVYDSVLNVSQPQLSLLASAAWMSTHYGALASAEALATIPWDFGSVPAQQYSGSLTAQYLPSRAVHFDAGVRGYLQNIPASVASAAASSGLQWTTFVGVILQPAGLQL